MRWFAVLIKTGYPPCGRKWCSCTDQVVLYLKSGMNAEEIVERIKLLRCDYDGYRKKTELTRR